MSDYDSFERRLYKRQMESDDDEDQEPRKKGRKHDEPDTVDTVEEVETNQSRKNVEEAINAIDRIQYELNMGNILDDSPVSSDNEEIDGDSDIDSEDDGDMLTEAHALGFAACIKETFQFLTSCGISPNDPIFKQLKNRFVGTGN
ncbi:unnamed protein product [Diamesa serratosioi]